MKKMITMFAATMVAVSAALTPAFGTTYAGVEFNGEKVQFEQDPVIENGRVLVPFRFVAEKLGAEVAWDAETKTVTCEKDGVKISLTANVKDVVVSGQSLEIDVPAQIMNSRVFVPLRFVADNMGADVEWDAENKTVKINTVEEKANDKVETASAVDATKATTTTETTTTDESTTEVTTADAKTTTEGTTVAESTTEETTAVETTTVAE